MTITIYRQRETENVIKLRAKKETIGSEFESIVSICSAAEFLLTFVFLRKQKLMI